MLRRLESSWSGPVPPEAALAKPPPIPYPRSNRRGAPPAKPSAGSTPTPSHLPEGFGPRKSDGVILSTARVPFCARCGFIKANLVKSDLATKTHACTICHQPVTTRHVYSRFQIERASFVAAAVIVALACFSLSAWKPTGDGLYLPWEKGANSWNLAALVLAFVLFGYAALTFLLRVPIWRRTYDAEKGGAALAQLGRFNWKLLLIEFFFAGCTALVTFGAWLAYITLASRGQIWK